ncbi:hypothetical protein [Rhizobium sp. YTU87027]|uniref:hypothetical protein n=1 Tax=Rhizobium sp. YTU87027 TaxID=3417741 RepID=UPI003D689B2D
MKLRTTVTLSGHLKRTLINRSDRAGHLERARDSVKWKMIHWILVKTRSVAAEVLSVPETPSIK